MRCSFLILLVALSLNAYSNPVILKQQEKSVQEIFNQNVENIFQKALIHYSEKNYTIVESELQGLVDIYPLNHRSTAISYLLGRAQYKQKKFFDAEKELTKLIQQFPQSSYVDDSRFILAAGFFEQKSYFTSGEYLFGIIENSENNRLKDKVLTLLPILLTDYLELRDIGIYRSLYQSQISRLVLAFGEGVKRYRQREFILAENLFQSVVSKNLDYKFGDDSKRFLELIASNGDNKIKIGVILPLTGFYEEEAKKILSGIRYALQNNPAAIRLKIELVVKDSEGEVISTIRACKELIEIENVIAIIGEIESDKTAIIGALANPRGIPILAPTAAEAGLVQLSNNIIQMSPDVSIRGEMIAEYAINELGLETFVVLAPADQYGKTITDSFAKTVDRLHGFIMAESWYYQGATELRNQFRQIREIGFKKMERDSIAYEMPDLTISEIDSVIAELKRIARLEAEELEEPPNLKFADSTAIPITSIDAIYLPVYSDEISYVAPQFALFNIQCQILGGDFWNDEESLDKNKTYVEGCIFTSDLFIDIADPEYQKFVNRFRMETGTTPEKMEIYGYDTINYLIQAVKSKALNPQELLKQLHEIKLYDGLLHKYSFYRKPGVNSHLNILKYEDNTISKLR